jgi:hypothetical protein
VVGQKPIGVYAVWHEDYGQGIPGYVEAVSHERPEIPV